MLLAAISQLDLPVEGLAVGRWRLDTHRVAKLRIIKEVQALVVLINFALLRLFSLSCCLSFPLITCFLFEALFRFELSLALGLLFLGFPLEVRILSLLLYAFVFLEFLQSLALRCQDDFGLLCS